MGRIVNASLMTFDRQEDGKSRLMGKTVNNPFYRIKLISVALKTILKVYTINTCVELYDFFLKNNCPPLSSENSINIPKHL